MKTVRIAVCQIFGLDGDRAGNFIRIENALREAAAEKAQIACFPEAILLGWVNDDAHNRACSIPGADTDCIAQLARQYGTWICAGICEKSGDRLYDSAVLVDAAGRIRLKHRKINILTELMTPPYTPGTEVDTVDTPFGRVGLLICADTFRHDILERMASLKPDLMLAPYGWAAAEEKWPDHAKELHKVVSHAAVRTAAPVVGTNLVGQITKGPWSGQVYGGQSIVSKKNGDPLITLADRDRDIGVVEVQLA